MKNYRLYSLAALLTFVPVWFGFESWRQPISQPPATETFADLVTHPSIASSLIVASQHQIYRKDSSGGHWSKTPLLSSSLDRPIFRLEQFPEFPNTIFALTKNKVYATPLLSGSCRDIFRVASPSEESLLSFYVLPQDPDHWFVGTSRGLQESDDGGKIWYPFLQLEKSPISLIRMLHESLWMASENTLYRSRDLIHFEKSFSLPKQTLEEEREFLEDFEDQDAEPDYASQIHTLTASRTEATLWLGTSRGVYESRNDGQSWQALSTSGLLSLDIKHLVYAESIQTLIAGTEQGIYRYDVKAKKWTELFQSKPSGKILSLVLHAGTPEKLLTLTPSGFFEYPLEIPVTELPASRWVLGPETTERFQTLITSEPTIQSVHRHVIRSADLSSWKIKRWHTESRLSALLPTFSFGKDLSRTPSIDIDRGGTNDIDKYMVGPESRRRSWDASVNWNLGDFIWSSAQTSIDSREKLMMELRHDFLAEATRLYFERRRLQRETVFIPVESEAIHAEQLLRLEELTALLDSMTDSWMSSRLEKMYQRNPDLEKLWIYSAPEPLSTQDRKNNVIA